MIYRPASVEQLKEQLVRANAQGQQGVLFELHALNRILEYTPEDMTVTVEGGVTLAALQQRLSEHRQWLPIDPPNPDRSTIADILNFNTSGPRRFGYGSIREYLLGLRVVLADGRVVYSGGKVVKNVAGYDLCKLFVGSRSTLGVIVEATFKVRPLPEAEHFLAARCDNLSEAARLLEAIHNSELMPVILDLQNIRPLPRPAHTLSPTGPSPRRSEDRGTSETSFGHAGGGEGRGEGENVWIVLGLAGTREEVDWQVEGASKLGLSTPTNLEYERIFWSAPASAPSQRTSVLPSRTCEAIADLAPSEFVARAGNGIIFYRGGKPPAKPEMPRALMQRIKEAYDPKHLFADF